MMSSPSPDPSFEIVDEKTNAPKPSTCVKHGKPHLRYSEILKMVERDIQRTPIVKYIVPEFFPPEPEFDEAEFDRQARAEAEALKLTVSPLQKKTPENCAEFEEDSAEEEEASGFEYKEDEEEDELGDVLDELEDTRVALDWEKEKHRKTVSNLIRTEIKLSNSDNQNWDLKLKAQELETMVQNLQNGKQAQDQELMDIRKKLTWSTISNKRHEVSNDALTQDWVGLCEELEALKQMGPQKLQEQNDVLEPMSQTNAELIKENRLLRDENRYRLKEHEELRNELVKATPILQANRALKNQNLEIYQYCVELQKKCIDLTEKQEPSCQIQPDFEQELKNKNSKLSKENVELGEKCEDLNDKNERLLLKNQELMNGFYLERGHRIELQTKVQQLEMANSDLKKMVTHFIAALDIKDSESAVQSQTRKDNQQKMEIQQKVEVDKKTIATLIHVINERNSRDNN